MNYYQLLSVDPSATLVEIKAAYHERIKQYHPDVNPGSDEVYDITRKLNDAYDTLKDPLKRIEYDNWLKMGGDRHPDNYPGAHGKEAEYDEGDIPDLRCEKCGRKDSSLRVTVFLYTFSIVLATFRKPWGKILCSRCRIKYSNLFNIITFLFGWWGIPYGPVYSIQSLFTNMGGGSHPKRNNDTLMSILAYNYYSSKEYKNAYDCLIKKSVKTSGDLELLRELESYAKFDTKSTFGKRHPRLHNALCSFPIWLFLLLLLIGLFA